MIYLRLFYEFFKAGLFAVGGGLATVPFLQNIGASTGWFSAADLANMIAVSESTPGPMGVNMATYVGFTVGGVPGAVVATLGLICPSIIVIVIVASVLDRFRGNKYVEYVFYGLRPASTGLIAAACWGVVVISLLHITGVSGMQVTLEVSWAMWLVAAAVYLFTHWEVTKKLHPVLWIALSALAGIVFQL